MTEGALRARPLFASTIAIGALDGATRDGMWALYTSYYAETSRAVFDRDLAEKNHVIVIRDPRGWSRALDLKVFDQSTLGRRFVAVSPATPSSPKEYWGQTVLQRAFLSYVMRVKLSHPFVRVLLVPHLQGLPTYLLLSRNFPEYWPRHDRPTPVFPRRSSTPSLAAATPRPGGPSAAPWSSRMRRETQGLRGADRQAHARVS